MTDWMTFVTDPSFGIPVLLLAGALAVWWAANLRDPPISALRRTSRPVADQDPVSRVVNAMASGRYSYVLAEARDRLDLASRRRFGVPAGQLPRTRWGARRMPASEVPRALALRRLHARLERLEALSLRREGGIWLRLDFWRSHAELLRRFRARLAPLLHEVTTATTARPT